MWRVVVDRRIHMTSNLPPIKDSKPLYPGSFFKFLVLAFLLVCAPLVVGLIQLTTHADSLAKRGEQTMRGLASFARDVQSLQGYFFQMERVARHSIALVEPPSQLAFNPLHEQFSQVALRLLDANLPANSVAQLDELIKSEAELQSALHVATPLTAMPTQLTRMNHALDALGDSGNAASTLEMVNIRKRVAESQTQALITIGVALPLALFIAAFFTVLLARPVRRIERAINRMGAGRLDDPINIGGPKDVQMLGQRLDWLRLRLRELETERELLSQSLSHDLKTPLTSIHEGVDLLMQGVAGPLNPQQDEIVQIMRQSANAMNSNIESLLISRSGELRNAPVALEPIAIRELLGTVIKRHELSARARHLSLEIKGQELHLNGDRFKLNSVFDNLLSNAIRFSPLGGHVLFELTALLGVARIEVSDEGQGISVSDAAQVFESGFRAGDSAAHGVKGSGVGLAITREFVLAHGGQIHLDPHGSRLNEKGARFIVEMPGLTH
jgi:two-component system, NtrC family, sensor histidine kinase GlrK